MKEEKGKKKKVWTQSSSTLLEMKKKKFKHQHVPQPPKPTLVIYTTTRNVMNLVKSQRRQALMVSRD